MTRDTIDFGIDLGTTNSSIAMYKEGKVEIIKNNDGSDCTPSAVWINKHNSLVVGREAKEHLEDDSENASCEFKRLMGSADKKIFSRNQLSMSPEELSAEVLKELKANARQREDEDISAAVITVPADFLLPENAATKRAGELAGLSLVHLLLEPVAASLAYGFQSQSEKVFWLVYDFGGGTFDTAIIQVRDGFIEVVNHEGDRLLGGKNIDWHIVEKLMVPSLLKERKLVDFKRGNKKWRSVFAKLKWHAEEAKIAVSRRNSFDISINFTKEDGFDEHFRFDYELHQKDVATIAEPSITKTIEICRKVMSDKRLAGGNIEKVLLVGGPTLAPYLRLQLADNAEGLGIPLESRVDPMTVVARGAAYYAGTQRMPSRPKNENQLEKGNYLVTFPDWKFTGSDTEPVVAAIIESPNGQNTNGFSIELINNSAKPAWRSGKLSLNDGRFMTTLWADKKETNIYKVELSDNTGGLVNTTTAPENLSYTVGLTFTQPPLTHSLGLALVNNEFLVILEKGTPLPAHKRAIVHTIMDVKSGQKDNLLQIVVLEGENLRANRNNKISVLEIPSHQIKRDLPAGSDVEVTIDIDKSRMVKTKAFIPILDEEFENVISMEADANRFDPKAFAQELEKEKTRLQKIREKVKTTNDDQAKNILQKVDKDQLVQQTDDALAASADDADDAKICQSKLLELRKSIDSIEDAVEWPALVQDAESLIIYGKDVAQQHGTKEEKSLLEAEESKMRITFQSHDIELLEHQIESYSITLGRILQRIGYLPVIRFQALCDRKEEMSDQNKATQLISEGIRAMNANDAERLETINRQLMALLPKDVVDEIKIGR